MNESSIKARLNQIKQNIFNQIEKSHISEAFGHRESLKLHKTGKEIKTRLQEVKEKYESHIDQCTTEMAELLNQCGIVPSEEPSSYMFESYKDKFDSIPKMFSWKQCEMSMTEEKQESMSGESQPQSPSNQDKQQMECCEKYNSKVRLYIRTKVDIHYINTMMSGLQDNKQYELTVNQAATLGF